MHTNAVFAIVLFLSLVASQQFDVPVLLWSGQSYFDGVNAAEPVSPIQLSKLFDALVSTQQTASLTLANPNALKSVPEVIVVFMHDQLRTDQTTNYFANEVYSNLKKTLASGASSLLASGPSGPNMHSLITKIEGTVVYAGQGDPFGAAVEACIAVEQLNAYLKDNAHLFGDGITDLILVQFAPTNQQEQIFADQVVGDVMKTIEQATNNYVALFSAKEAQAPETVLFEIPATAKRGIQQVPTMEPTTAPPSNGTTHEKNWFEKYFPGWFWTQFIVNFTLFIILMIGLLAISDIQVHDHFRSPPKRRTHDD